MSNFSFNFFDTLSYPNVSIKHLCTIYDEKRENEIFFKREGRGHTWL